MKVSPESLFRVVFVAAMLLMACVSVPVHSVFAQQPDAVPEAKADSAPEPADTEEAPEVEEVVELKVLSDEQNKSLEETWMVIRESDQIIKSLEGRVAGQSDLMREILETRLDSLFAEILEVAMGFAEKLADLRDDGYDISAYSDQLNMVLEELPPTIRDAADRIATRVVLPDFSKSAAEQAAIDEQFFAAVRSYYKTNKALLKTAAIQDRFGIDTTDLVADVRENLSEGAANTSIFLDLAIVQVKDLGAGVVALPEDAELKAKLKVAQDRVNKVAAILESNLSVMTEMDIPTAEYKQQLLKSTGSITASSLDVEVISGLLQDWSDALVEMLIEQGPGLLFQLLFFIAIIFIFMKLAGLVQRGVNSALDANKKHLSRLLRQMISSTSKNIVIILGILIALSQVGISLGPLLTGLGIAGFIIGFALQDSLSNFASGMLILFYRPFDVGDTIEAGGARGKVSSMSLVNTTIRTFDNQSLIIPNNKIWQDVITNVTDQKERRVDMTFGITYDQDIDRVEKLLLEIVNADDRVLDDPEPFVKVGSFGDSSVNLLCRPWVKTDDYWDVLWDLNKKVKQAFDREGIVIPFPQRDVHIFHEQPAAPQVQNSSFSTPNVPEGNEPAGPEDDDQ